jgi:hypothetical protein
MCRTGSSSGRQSRILFSSGTMSVLEEKDLRIQTIAEAMAKDEISGKSKFVEKKEKIAKTEIKQHKYLRNTNI